MSEFLDKDSLKEQLELENVFDLLTEFGGDPSYTSFGIVSRTICHNQPGQGSRKLYYYTNSNLFTCFTSCNESFDIFDLVIKVAELQWSKEWTLFEAMDYVATFFGLKRGRKEQQKKKLDDWRLMERYNYVVNSNFQLRELPRVNPEILGRFSYPRILDWEEEGILPEVYRKNFIGYYPGGEAITIPHFDINGNLIGIRGRMLADDDSALLGKYRPLTIGGVLYSHPLSLNLYNLNKSKNNIAKMKTAIIVESEKATMQFQSIYGAEKDITVACCGSSISNYQINLLAQLGVNEIIVAFDRQFQVIGDDEHQRLKNKILSINKKYGARFKMSAIFDKNMITNYKASPLDEGKEKFEILLKERIRL